MNRPTDESGLSSPGRALRAARVAQRHLNAHLSPVPPQRWHFTTLSPFFTRPLPSQFLHFCFFLMFGPFSLAMANLQRAFGAPWASRAAASIRTSGAVDGAPRAGGGRAFC